MRTIFDQKLLKLRVATGDFDRQAMIIAAGLAQLSCLIKIYWLDPADALSSAARAGIKVRGVEAKDDFYAVAVFDGEQGEHDRTYIVHLRRGDLGLDHNYCVL